MLARTSQALDGNSWGYGMWVPYWLNFHTRVREGVSSSWLPQASHWRFAAQLSEPRNASSLKLSFRLLAVLFPTDQNVSQTLLGIKLMNYPPQRSASYHANNQTSNQTLNQVFPRLFARVPHVLLVACSLWVEERIWLRDRDCAIALPRATPVGLPHRDQPLDCGWSINLSRKCQHRLCQGQ